MSMVEKEMEEHFLEVTKKWIKDMAEGTSCHEIGALTSKGIQFVKAHKGFLLCDFIIHDGLLDENGNWHASAIATLVDVIASCTTYTFTPSQHVTLDFSISYYSPAKVQEEVEVEGKVIEQKDMLTSVIVEVRKKQNGELVGLGKLWMAAVRNPRHQESKL